MKRTVRWVLLVAILSCGARTGVARNATKAPSAETPIRELITSFYQGILGRDPEPGAVDSWESGYFDYAVNFNIDVRFIPREMARLFFLSEEYAARHRSDAGFITDCYRVFLDRPPSQTELDNWLGGVWNRSQVMTIFAESEEFASRIEAMYPFYGGNPTRNFVTAMYIGLLDRLVDREGLEYGAGLFDAVFASGGIEAVRAQAKQMAREVIVSEEFLSKNPTTAVYVSRFYRSFLGRFPNDTEVTYWSGTVTGGSLTCDSLISLFADSEEFTARLNAFFGGPTPSPTPEEVTVFLPGDVPLVLVRIPAGSFQMGSPDTERSHWSAEGPVHTVSIAYDFYMGKAELTQRQWLAVMNSWPGTAPNSTHGLGANYPAYYISWNDCRSFITALNEHIANTGQGPATFRLPTEAEWEYGCRAGTQTRFFFGDSLSVGDGDTDGPAGTLPGNRSDYMWFFANNSPYGTKPVGTKLPNQFGLYDMSGNVWEWCQDYWHSSYTDAPSDGSAWLSPTSSYRVVRGGDWDSNAGNCRSAYRYSRADPDYRNNYIGVRFVRTQPPQTPTPTPPVTATPSSTATPTPTPSPTATATPTVTPSPTATPTPFTVYLPGDVPLVLVQIPAGAFQMGRYPGEQDSSSYEDPRHMVSIGYDFHMGKYEVTKAQWQAVMGTGPWSGESSVLDDPNSPAIYVSWNDVAASGGFVEKLNQHISSTGQGSAAFRLPSEAEWEYACRAGTQTRFYWGDDAPYTQIGDYAWYRSNAYGVGEGYAHVVGLKLPNAWALYDMSGNVCELCRDWWHSGYSGAPTDGSAWGVPTSSYLVVRRGGDWSGYPSPCRSAGRDSSCGQDYRGSDMGFRLLRTQD